jgi:ABC-type proline/glycine betaine transport system ATPase subunit
VSLFRLEGVTLRRGGATVLDDVDAQIDAGATCVWGPSGAGKSSLLRLLNRLADPDAGRVLFHDEEVRALDPLELRRRVVLAPQLPAPFPGTVADNVLYGPRLAHRGADVARVLDLVALPSSYAEREAARLSVGEQQRLMLARALALEPEVVLLDEPTSALDEAARDAVEETLARLRDEIALSLVIVTHDLAQARRLADWVVELEGGRVRVQGAAREVLAR